MTAPDHVARDGQTVRANRAGGATLVLLSDVPRRVDPLVLMAAEIRALEETMHDRSNALEEDDKLYRNDPALIAMHERWKGLMGGLALTLA